MSGGASSSTSSRAEPPKRPHSGCWRTPIANWHTAEAAAEAANNLIKQVKRAAFGFTNFAHYRIRALLHAGKPNWALLDTLTST